MKQSLQIRLGQQITMTPQLQQAIRLLQLSNLELQTEIQQLLDSNIMLEVDETESDTESSNDDEDINSETDDDFLNLVEDIPKELETDVDWDDIYNNNITLS
ncbi:MAG: RNA polymerase factor sigma-54, partial [Thiomargarita sp.]|nr:RNA polymerase factor sigma-54 [Thiomargarita sp.]